MRERDAALPSVRYCGRCNGLIEFPNVRRPSRQNSDARDQSDPTHFSSLFSLIMGFNCGIVGLPNVGKSALFNALTATQAAEATKYPFSTREANVGRVSVPDERLDVCARLAKSAKIVPTQLEFVDIAGLVRGASQGQGLGNQFLGRLREVDAIAHILRCFEDDNIVHVEGSVDPIRDIETVETELMLADLDSLERRTVAAQKRARGGDKEAKTQLALIEPV